MPLRPFPAAPPPACNLNVGGPREAENARNHEGFWGESGGQAGQGLTRACAPLATQTPIRGAPLAPVSLGAPPQRVISASEGGAEPKTRAIARESGESVGQAGQGLPRAREPFTPQCPNRGPKPAPVSRGDPQGVISASEGRAEPPAKMCSIAWESGE
jgi:hypothetical protein